MKYFSSLFVVLTVCGCSSKSPYDIAPAQAQKRILRGPGGLDLEHLPPGAVKHEQVFHKGDPMPDGTIADGERKIVTVTEEKPAP